jgi:hypothetical protein
MAIRDYGALAQQWRDLEAAGIPLEPAENRVGIARSRRRILTIRSEPHRLGGSEIRELKDGRFGYVLTVFIRSDSPGKAIVRDSWIAPPWTDPTFEWLEDPKKLGQHPAWYAFPRDTEQFARAEVINHRIRCVLSRGDIREGVLLGIGCGRPPEIYKHNAKVSAVLTLVDQWDCTHSERLEMRINRLAVRAKAI